jgi:predicted ATPase
VVDPALKHLLLVLDNCEHLLGAAFRLAEILSSCLRCGSSGPVARA